MSDTSNFNARWIEKLSGNFLREGEQLSQTHIPSSVSLSLSHTQTGLILYMVLPVKYALCVAVAHPRFSTLVIFVFVATIKMAVCGLLWLANGAISIEHM